MSDEEYDEGEDAEEVEVEEAEDVEEAEVEEDVEVDEDMGLIPDGLDEFAAGTDDDESDDEPDGVAISEAADLSAGAAVLESETAPRIEAISDSNTAAPASKPSRRNNEGVYSIIPESSRRTSNMLQKPETAFLISLRTVEISNGSHIFTDIKGLTAPEEIAKKELFDRQCPLKLVRVIGNNMTIDGVYYPGICKEFWDPKKMTLPHI